MPRFKVYGAHADTGEDVMITVTVDTQGDAESIANGRRILVSRIVEVETESPVSDLSGQANRPAVNSSEPEVDRSEERTIWEGHPSHLSNLAIYVIGVLFCWLLFPMLIAILRAIGTNFTTYTLTNQRLRVEYGVLSRRVSELELYRVKDTAMRQTFIERMKGIGDVMLRTSDRSSPVAVLRGVPKPRELREAIRTEVESLRRKLRVREFDMT